MRLAYAFPAAAAEISPDGKLFVLSGDFDTITAPAFPAVHQNLALVVKLQLTPMECSREHRLRVELLGADGAQLHPTVTIPFRAQPHSQHPYRHIGVSLVINYQGGTQFPRPGDYAFHILVDELELSTVPLYLVQGGTGPAAEILDTDER